MYKYILCCFSIFFSVIVIGQLPDKKIYSISAEPTFKNGEELNYTLKYGFIKGGEASIKVFEETYKGHNVIHAIASAHTSGLADKLFKVQDTFESYFTVDSNLPLRSIRNIREGSYRFYGEDHFNRNENTVINVKKGVQKVPANILDIISAFFYLRRIDFSNFKIGETIYIDTYFGDELFPFYVIFKGREEIETNAGKFKCLKFLPIVEPGRVFKDNDDMLFWLSDDSNKIPVKVKFEMVVGSFKCELASFKNLKYIQ
jgi:hypothetical protein